MFYQNDHQDGIQEDEFQNWHDRGCEAFPSCLHCPLASCLEDEPRGHQHARAAAFRSLVAELTYQGKSALDIATLVGKNVRTV